MTVLKPVIWNDLSKDEQTQLLMRPAVLAGAEIEKIVDGIVADVRARGDEALRDYAAKFDRTKLTSIRVEEKEIDEAEARLGDDIKAAMQLNPEEWTISGFYYNEETDEEEYIEDGCYLELPCWNTLWTPDFLIDEEWILENKKAICELGFRIIENTKEYTGTWLGIEGYGYSFMQEHFLPLYELRGLEWHKA